MGYVNVQLGGSFGNAAKYGVVNIRQFGAIDHGHADAVAQAIEYLAGTVLPAAVALDHELHDDGAKPRGGFTREGLGE